MNYLLRTKSVLALLAVCILSGGSLMGQSVNYRDNARINTVTTAVPFLRINPDARAGGMGEVGIASPADANAVYVNPAKLAFVDKDFGFAVGFEQLVNEVVAKLLISSKSNYVFFNFVKG